MKKKGVGEGSIPGYLRWIFFKVRVCRVLMWKMVGKMIWKFTFQIKENFYEMKQ